MTSFEDREKGFERKFAHDEELKFNDPARIKFIQMLADWGKDKTFVYGGREGKSTALFNAGDCVFHIASSGSATAITAALGNDKVGIAMMPYSPDVAAKPQNSIIGGATLWVLQGRPAAEYKGVAQFTKLDEQARRAVLLARGKDARGQGDATATVTATLTSEGGGTRVTVDTELALTGKVAQFGRGVLADVSGALMTLFAERLQNMVIAEGIASVPSPAPASVQAADSVQVSSRDAEAAQMAAPGRAPVRDDEVLDVLALAGEMPWSKALPAAGTVVSVVAALISVFAAGYASARARSVGR